MEDYDKKSIELIEVQHEISKDDITVVIPVLNEEEAIRHVLNSVQDAGYRKIIVVDGHSKDNTVQIVKKTGVKLFFQEGKGKTGALKTAFQKINTPFVIIMDGDCTYDPNEIENFFPYISKYDQVIGKRSIGTDKIPPLNRVGNHLINKLFNIIFNTKLSDVCSGMYALTTDFANKIKLETSGFDVEVEIAALASIYGKIIEIPINYYERVGVQKLRPIRDGYRIISSIFLLGIKHRQLKLIKLFAFVSFLSTILIIGFYFIYPFSIIKMINTFNTSLSSIRSICQL